MRKRRHGFGVITNNYPVLNTMTQRNRYMRQWTTPPLLEIMAWRLIGAKPLSETMMGYCQIDPFPWEQNSWHQSVTWSNDNLLWIEFINKHQWHLNLRIYMYIYFLSRIYVWNMVDFKWKNSYPHVYPKLWHLIHPTLIKKNSSKVCNSRNILYFMLLFIVVVILYWVLKGIIIL